MADLWVPDNSITFANHENYQSTWAMYEDEIVKNNLIVSLKDDPSGNVLNEENLILLLELYDTINEMEIEHNGVTYSYQDICARYENGNCRTVSILELFMYDLDTITSTYNFTNITYPSVYSPYSFGSLYVPSVLGQEISTEFIDNEYLTTSASAFSMDFWIDITMNGDEIYRKWNDEFISVAEQYGLRSNTLEVYYQGHYSFDDEIIRSVLEDAHLIAIAFFVFFIFSTAMVLRFKRSADRKCIQCDGTTCRGRIGWLGFVSSIMAVSSSWGLVGGIFGVDFEFFLIINPILLVGIGGLVHVFSRFQTSCF